MMIDVAYASTSLFMAGAIVIHIIRSDIGRLATGYGMQAGTSIGGAAAIIVLSQTSLVFSAVVSTIDLRRFNVLGQITFAGAIWFCIVAAIAFTLVGFDRRSIANRLRPTWPLMVLAIWSSLRTLPSLDADGMQNALALVSLILAIAASRLIAINYPQKARALWNLLGFLFTLFSITWVLLEVTVPHLTASPRFFALWGTLGVSYFLGSSGSGRPHSQLSLAVALALILAIGLSLSRMALAVSLLLVPFAYVRPERVRGWLGPIALGTLLFLVGLLAIQKLPALNQRFTSGDVQRIGAVEIAVEGRWFFWTTVLGATGEAPLLGKGPGSAAELMLKATRGRIEQPHNEYLRLLYEFGAVGLMLAIVGLSGLARHLFKEWQELRRLEMPAAQKACAAFLATIAIAVSMATDNTLTYMNVTIVAGFLIGLASGDAHLNRDVCKVRDAREQLVTKKGRL